MSVKKYTFNTDKLRVRDVTALQGNDLEEQAHIMARVVDELDVDTVLDMPWKEYRHLQRQLVEELGKTLDG